MGKMLLLISVLALLSARYVVHQKKFERPVPSWIRVDMPFSQAISTLESKGLICTGNQPASCGRIRQGLKPYSCVERVNVRFSGPWMLVDAIEIPKIVCAGL